MLKMRSMRRTIILIATFVMILGMEASAQAVVFNVSGSLDAGDPTMPSRIFRDGIASTCAGKAFPGTFAGAPPYNYEVFGSYGPVPAGTCVTVNWDEGDCTVNAHPMAYTAGTFSPATFAAGTGYLGDIGSSATGSFSFTMASQGSFDIVVTSTFGPATCNFSFNFDIPVIATVQEVIPHVSDVRIQAGANVPAYDSPAGSPARLAGGQEIFLPQDSGGDGADTYIVADSAVVDGVTWVQIFLGDDDNMVWVLLSQVELIGPTP